MQLNEHQQLILKQLETVIGKDNVDFWLSTPNSMFANRPPGELLFSGNYEYFNRYLGAVNIVETT